MMPVNRTDTAIQPGSTVTLDLAPSVVFVAMNATATLATLRHPCGATITVPTWRVRLMAR